MESREAAIKDLGDWRRRERDQLEALASMVPDTEEWMKLQEDLAMTREFIHAREMFVNHGIVVGLLSHMN